VRTRVHEREKDSRRQRVVYIALCKTQSRDAKNMAAQICILIYPQYADPGRADAENAKTRRDMAENLIIQRVVSRKKKKKKQQW